MSSTNFLALSTFLVVILSLTSCGNGGQDRETATVKATSVVPVDVGKARMELDQVLGALRILRDSSEGADLKKLDADVKGHTAALNSALADVDASSKSAVTAGQSQVQAWHQQADGFTDAELRNASSKRQENLRTAVDALSASRVTYVTTSQAFAAKVNQAAAALDLDLTQQGVLSLKPVLSHIIDDDTSLRTSLNDIADKSRAVNAMLNP